MYIKAFTIIEVIVTMIISMFVIIIAFTGFNIINSSYINYNKENDRTEKTLFLNNILLTDISSSKIIERNYNELICTKPNLEKAVYTFNDDKIIYLNGLIKDTFLNEIVEYKTTFNNQDITSGIADEVSISFIKDKDTLQFNIIKEYGIDIKMQYEEE